MGLPTASVIRGAAATHDAAAARELSLRRELTVIYDEHAASLLRYARSVTQDFDFARDAVQETFFRYFVHRRAGNTIDNERAWLFRVVRNVVCDHATSADQRHSVPLENQTVAVDPRPGLEHGLDVAQLSQRLPELLSARELDCLRLRNEGLRYEEIAAALNLRSGTVGALLTRALTKLRDAFRVRPCDGF